MKTLMLLAGLAASLHAAKAKPLDQLISDLRFGTPEVREAAIDQLAEQSSKKAVPALLEALSDSDGMVKLKVVQALGEARDGSASAHLASLLQDPAPELRAQAAKALGKIADGSQVPALEARLKDADAEVRSAAALALGQNKSGKSAKAVEALLKDPLRLVRLSAVDALGMLGEPSSLPALKSQLGDKDASYRRHVVKAVASLGSGAEIVELLTRWLEDPDPYLRGFSAEALALKPRAAQAEDKLVALLLDPVLAVKIRATETLGAWKSADAVAPLKRMLRDANATLRWKAALALGRIGDPAAADALNYLALNDPELEIKKAAAESLELIKAAGR